MITFYADESGSICSCNQLSRRRWFIVSLVKIKNEKSLKRAYKRYISSRLDDLMNNSKDSSKMFKDDKFIELKGSAMTPKQKMDFLSFFCKNSYFEVYYIVVDNSCTEPYFSSVPARAFNYLMKLNLLALLNRNYTITEDHLFHIDNQNVRTESKATLEDYLNTELQYQYKKYMNVKIEYSDSSVKKIIQIADVFSNILYSSKLTETYGQVLNKVTNDGYIKFCFEFPILSSC